MASKQKAENEENPVRRGMRNLWKRIRDRFRGSSSTSKDKKSVNVYTISECDAETSECCSSESIHLRESFSFESKKDEMNNCHMKNIPERTDDVFSFKALTPKHLGYKELVGGTEEEISQRDGGKRNAKEESLPCFEKVPTVDDQKFSKNVTENFGMQDNESVKDRESSYENTQRKRSPRIREVLPKPRTRSTKSIVTSGASTSKQETWSGATSRRDNCGDNAFREYISRQSTKDTNYTDFTCFANLKHSPMIAWSPNIQNFETKKSEEKCQTNSSTVGYTQVNAIQKTDTKADKEFKKNFDCEECPNGETNQKAKITNNALKSPNLDSTKKELKTKRHKKFRSERQTSRLVIGGQTTDTVKSGEKAKEEHENPKAEYENPKAGEGESIMDNKNVSLGTDSKGSVIVAIESNNVEVANEACSTDVPTGLEEKVKPYTFANHIGTKASGNTVVPVSSSAAHVMDMPYGFDRGIEYRMDGRQCIGKGRRGKKTEDPPKKAKRRGIPNKHLKNANAYLQEDAINHDLDDIDDLNKSETEKLIDPVNKSSNAKQTNKQRKMKKRNAGRRNKNTNNCANDDMISDEESDEESDDGDEDDSFDDDTCLILQARDESSVRIEYRSYAL